MFKLARAITADEIAAYNVSGVVQLRGVLDLRAVNTLRRFIDDATDTLHKSPAGYDLSAVTRAVEQVDQRFLESSSNGQHDVAGICEFIRASGEALLIEREAGATGSFKIDTGIVSRISGFDKLCLRGAVPEIAAALLDSEQINFLGDQIFVKEPQSREKTAFHQDAPYFEIEGNQCCVMWIPVDPVTVKNGGMTYVRGSHRGNVYAPNVFISRTRLPEAEGDLLPDIEARPEHYDLVSFDVEPGDIVVHHYKTIHGAGGNLSRYQVRRAASLRYCGDDIRFRTRAGAPAQLHHSAPRLQDGDRLCGPDYPVVWQRKGQAVAA